MRLFDDQGNVNDINIEDIVCIKREVVQRKTLFNTGSEYLHDPNTLVELVKAYQTFGFHQIDKNKLINLNKVDKYKDGYLWIGDTKYLVSRRIQPTIQEYLTRN
jgi:DNA-binding LytR/AlgR family response regulator